MKGPLYHENCTKLRRIFNELDRQFKMQVETRAASLKRMMTDHSFELTNDQHSEFVVEIRDLSSKRHKALHKVLLALEDPENFETDTIYKLDKKYLDFELLHCTVVNVAATKEHHSQWLAEVNEEVDPRKTGKKTRKLMKKLWDEYNEALYSSRDKKKATLQSQEVSIETLHEQWTDQPDELHMIKLLEALVQYAGMVKLGGGDILTMDLNTIKLSRVFASKDYIMPAYARRLSNHLLSRSICDAAEASVLLQRHSVLDAARETRTEELEGEKEQLLNAAHETRTEELEGDSIEAPQNNHHEEPCDTCTELDKAVEQYFKECHANRQAKNAVLTARNLHFERMISGPTYIFQREDHEKYLASLVKWTHEEHLAEHTLYTVLRKEATHGGPEYWSVIDPYNTIFRLKWNKYTPSHYEKELARSNKVLNTPKGQKQMRKIRQEHELEYRVFMSNIQVKRERDIRWSECDIKDLHDDWKKAQAALSDSSNMNPDDELVQEVLGCKIRLLNYFVSSYMRLIDPAIPARIWHLDLSSMELSRIDATPGDYTPPPYAAHLKELCQTRDEAKAKVALQKTANRTPSEKRTRTDTVMLTSNGETRACSVVWTHEGSVRACRIEGCNCKFHK